MSRLDAVASPEPAERWHPLETPGRHLLLVVVAGFAVAGVIGLADAVGEQDGLSRLDPIIAADILSLRAPKLTLLAQTFTLIGSELAVGGLAIVVFAPLLWRRRLERAVLFAVGIGGSAVLTVAVKHVVARPRPSAVDRLGPVDTTFSFPSGHTLNSAVFLALVAWLLWSSVRSAGRASLLTAGAVLALGVAASRVYLGYHWFTDVVASFLVALAWLSLLRLLRAAVQTCRRPGA